MSVCINGIQNDNKYTCIHEARCKHKAEELCARDILQQMKLNNDQTT